MGPMIGIKVGGIRRSIVTEAVIDTGFDGEVCLPLHLAVTLGLELIGTETVELGDGSLKVELLFAGSAVFQGRRKDIRIFLTSGGEALVGTELLTDYRLTIDFPKNKVHLSFGRRRR